MGCVLLLSLMLALTFYALPISAKMEENKAYITFPGDEDFKCKLFPFKENITNAHVQLRLLLDAYQAAVTWVESVSAQGFTGCVAISGPRLFKTIYLTWMAFEPSDVVPIGGLVRQESIPLWTTGTTCIEINSGNQFSGNKPKVFLTVVHTDPPKNIHDATSVWAEEVTPIKFKVCLRELKNFDGVHENIRVNVLALSAKPSAWDLVSLNDVNMPNTGFPSEKYEYSFCQTVSFDPKYYSVPKVMTTAAHDKLLIEPDNNAITEWVTSVDKEKFEVCLKDIQRYDAQHDAVTINLMVIGRIDPCDKANCSPDKFCVVNEDNWSYTCVCSNCDKTKAEVCDTNGVTHLNLCTFNRLICLEKTNATKDHDGACAPFVMERGRVALRLSTTDVQCKTVNFNPASFQSNETRINVHTSINYFNYSGNFIHDAAVTWIESVTFTSFKVCVLKAGRAERLTPDNGVTFVDYIAFQESPAGAESSHLSMDNWWDGTTCKSVTFDTSYSTTPYVFLSAEHSVKGIKHDAATVWVENVNTKGFQACLRELQNFDGLHENITVNWVAYQTLEKAAELNITQQRINFENDDVLPKPGYHNAFCQEVSLGKSYSKTPTIIVSASHTPGVVPEYNSIASWIESINVTYYQLCVKEIHNPNGYDPVKVTALIVGS